MGFVFPNNGAGAVALTVPIVMLLWIPIVLLLFTQFSARKAVIISFLAAWLFLPQASMEIIGIPDFNKMNATSYGILIATLLFDAKRITSFRPSWIDIPMVIWCLCPYASSLTNELAPEINRLYDGFSSSLGNIVAWGIPYFLGRIYLNSLEGLRQMARAIFIGGLIYVPLCLFEIRMSPQLHRIVYGGFAHSFEQTMRFGGFRPTVFMETGLAVAAFMMAALLAGIWFWRSGQIKQIWGIPIEWLLVIMAATLVLSKSFGAYALLATGLAILFVGMQFNTALPLYIVVMGMAVYIYVNTVVGTYFGDQLLETLSGIFPPERLQSLEFRLNNEELLAAHAREKFWFGWAGWGRSLVNLDPWGRKAIQDSLWVLSFGMHGIVGVTSVFTAMLLPPLKLFSTRYSPATWTKPKVAGAAVISVILVLYAADCLLNAMVNPIYLLACGGIAGIAVQQKESVHKMVRQKLVAVQRSLSANE
jgi:hypothetical protein